MIKPTYNQLLSILNLFEIPCYWVKRPQNNFEESKGPNVWGPNSHWTKTQTRDERRSVEEDWEQWRHPPRRIIHTHDYQTIRIILKKKHEVKLLGEQTASCFGFKKIRPSGSFVSTTGFAFKNTWLRVPKSTSWFGTHIWKHMCILQNWIIIWNLQFLGKKLKLGTHHL